MKIGFDLIGGLPLEADQLDLKFSLVVCVTVLSGHVTHSISPILSVLCPCFAGLFA
jgi:hypothetical protein